MVRDPVRTRGQKCITIRASDSLALGTSMAEANPDPGWVQRHTNTATLRDGTSVLIRPILPEDKPHLVMGLQKLSPKSRYLRFHYALSRLNEDELRYLTEIDYHEHFAWAAFALDETETSMIGVARYIRMTPSSDQAEAAVAIIDDYQGRGLGTIVLALLTRTARDHGIRFFIAYVQPVNTRVIRLARRAGAVFYHEDGMLRLEVPLEDSDAGIRAVLSAAAASEIFVRPEPSES